GPDGIGARSRPTRPGRCAGIERLLDCLMDFAVAKRAFSPPFGSTVNAPSGRPPGPQPSNTCGLCLENADAFPTPHRPKVYQQQYLFEISSYGHGGASLAALATPLDGTQAGNGHRNLPGISLDTPILDRNPFGTLHCSEKFITLE